MSDEADLMPTGTCFEDVSLEFIRLITKDVALCKDHTFCMVHGICLLEDEKPYAHAWIEHGERVDFPAIYKGQKGFATTLREEFYRVHQVQEVTRYDYRKALRASVESGDKPPPWEEKYLRLCKDYPGPR